MHTEVMPLPIGDNRPRGHGDPSDPFPLGPGPYESLVRDLVPQYPNFHYLAHYMRRQRERGFAESGRAAVLEFNDNQDQPHVEIMTSSARLRQYLEIPRKQFTKRLFLLEDVTTNFVEAVGTALLVDPYFFAAHTQMTR